MKRVFFLGLCLWLIHVGGLWAQERSIKSSPKVNQNDLLEAVLLLFTELKEEGKTTLRWLDIKERGGREVSYYIYRHRSKIDSKAALSKAEYLDTVSAGVMRYEDFLAKKGKYYYGVFAVIDKAEKRIFIDGHNITDDFGVINKNEYRGETIRLVRARPTKEDDLKIDLHWIDIKDKEGVSYLIYKANRLLETLDLVKGAAKQVARVKRGEMAYVDQLEDNEPTYYAIVAEKNGKLFESSFGENSYSKAPIYGKAPIDSKALIKKRQVAFDGLKGEFDKGYFNIIVSWEEENLNDTFEASLYGSTEPIVSTQFLKKAKRLTSIDSKQKAFLHTNIDVLKPNYYAIGVKLKGSKTYLDTFSLGRNHTQKALIKYPMARGLKAIFLEDKKVVELQWSLDKGKTPPLEVLIYRFEGKLEPKTFIIEDLVKQKPIIQTNLKRYQTRDTYTFYDQKLKENAFYQYVVLLQLLNPNPSKPIEQTKWFPVPLILAENVSPKLVEIGEFNIVVEKEIPKKKVEEKKEKKHLLSDLKKIISRYFYKGKYYLAENALETFLKEGKAKRMNEKKYAYLYLGRTKLELGDKKKALFYFKLLKKVDRELGLFWLRLVI